MRILHVVDQMDPERGGVCQAIRTMIKGISLFNVSNEVVTLDDPNSQFLSAEEFPVYALGPANNAWTYSKGLKAWLIGNLPNYDKVILHGLWQYPGYAVHMANQYLLNITNQKTDEKSKIYVMPHGMLDPYFQRAPGRKLKAIRNTIYWRFIEKKVINSARSLLFTCEDEKILARLPFKPYRPIKESVVGLGVEAPPKEESHMHRAFADHCAGLDKSRYLLFLSRIHEKKGVDILIMAYAAWKKKHIKLSRRSKELDMPKLVIAGPGIETGYGQGIANIVASDDLLRDSVIFPGMLVDDAKWGAFYGCEAFILPSHQENFGIAVVEAMACGKAVLISNQINIWREIEESHAGIVNPNTLQGTLQGLDRWTEMSIEERENMGKNAIKAFMDFFTVERAAKRLLHTLSEG